MSPSELPDLDASELSRRIARRELSCRELMAASLDRIERLNPQFNAIVSLRDRAQLLAEAEAHDALLARGERLGWMHGFPLAVKDLSPARGLPTTCGSPALARQPASADALFVERMRRAGAIVIGKTNTPEFGLGSHTYNPVFGTTRNAYDPSRTAGGSSGGAAVALALRMLPVADGSDMGGSLRNPAAYNNIVGFRPSRGRVPSVPADELFFQQLGCEGPMGRSVEDVARLLSVMAGWDDRSPLALTDSLPGADADDPIAAMHGKRIGWLGSIWPDLPLEPGILALCEGALKQLESLGCHVEPCTLDFPRERNWMAWLRLRQFLVAGKLAPLYAEPRTRALLKPEAVWEVEHGLALTGPQLYEAAVARSALYLAFRALFARYDYLIAPTAQVFPFDAGISWPRQIGTTAMDSYHRWMEIVTPFTLAGVPVVSMPVGFSAEGLPMGMQIAGPVNQDLSVLALARAYERVSGWGAKHKPPVL